ncbi:unnamed protein product [Ascophyllum nodosum]
MGRKRGVPARARENAVAESAAEAVEVEQREALLSAKSDAELFIVDTVGSNSKRRKLQKEAKTDRYASKVEENIIARKYLRRGQRSGQAARQTPAQRRRISDPWADEDGSHATTTTAQRDGQGNSGAVTVATSSSPKDSSPRVLSFLPALRGCEEEAGDAGLSTSGKPLAKKGSKSSGEGVSGAGACVGGAGDDDFLQLPPKQGQPLKRPKPSAKDLAKLGVCHPGQSYNPTPEDHQDVLAGAVAVELRRQEAIDQEAKPVSAGMSKETLELLIGDEEGEGSSEEEGEEGSGSLGGPTPATGKLTRAQRNKQKRFRAAKHELLQRRKRKKMLKTIDDISTIQQEVAERERLRDERRRTKRLLKEQQTLQEQGAEWSSLFGPSAGVALGSSMPKTNKDIIETRSVPVNLSEELHGSLRQLRAQGSVLLDKVELLKASKAHPDRRRAKERAKKASKGFRKKYTIKDRYKDDPVVRAP